MNNEKCGAIEHAPHSWWSKDKAMLTCAGTAGSSSAAAATPGAVAASNDASSRMGKGR